MYFVTTIVWQHYSCWIHKLHWGTLNQTIAKCIWELCISNDIWTSAVHIPRKENSGRLLF